MKGQPEGVDEQLGPGRFEDRCSSPRGAAAGVRAGVGDRGLTCNWVGGFDLPFGLPRGLVEHLGWPNEWGACMDHYCALTRADIRSAFAAFCAARPVGAKFAHRRTDGSAGSSPSMKWVNPPVAYMMHAGVPLLRAAGVDLPGLCVGDPQRVALEAYPALLAREVLGRASYKADDRKRQTQQRLVARERLVGALEQGATRLELRLSMSAAERERAIQDAGGDHLDAALCLMQAGWAFAQHRGGHSRWGLPDAVDPLEGWIVTAPVLRSEILR
ncbi:MAG: DUF429 domain-containing protein [Burkholderiales bacterium]